MAIVLGLTLLALSCSESAPSSPEPNKDSAAPPAFESVADAESALRLCPDGDLPWRNGIRLGNANQELRGPLITLGQELEETCADAWQPVWLQAELSPPEARAERFTDCLARAREHDSVGVARCANELAWLRYQAAQLDESEALYAEAITAAVAAERKDLASYARGNYSGLLVERGRYAAASELMKRTEQDLRSAGETENALWAAYNQAVLSVELGDAIGSEALLDRVLTEGAASGDQWITDASRVVRGNLHLALGELDEATASFAQVSQADVSLRLRAELGLARRLIRSGQPHDAAAQLRQTLELPKLDAVGRTLVEAYLGDALFRSGADDWEDTLRQALANGDIQEAASPRWTARWLLGHALSEEGRFKEAEALLQESTQLLDNAQSELDPSTLGLRFLKERSEPYVELALLHARRGPDHHEPLLAAMQRIHARSLRSGSQSALELSDLKKGIPARHLVMATVLGRDGGVLLAINRDRTQAIEIPGRQEMAPWIQSARSALGQGEALPDEISASLSDSLLAPLTPLLSETDELWIVPDGELALLPWGALQWDNSPLLASADLAFLPWIGHPPTASAKLSPVLLAGRPEFSETDSWKPLPWAGFEISEIKRIWPSSATLVGNDFRLDAFVKAARSRQYSTFHLATHAVASTRDPRKCGLVLSGGERLGLEEIEALPLRDALVILSACRTGEGELLPGEGVVGLRWALLKAGARGIVVTQWTVDDRATARLMSEMHGHMRDGKSVVRALSLARRESLADQDSSLAWAPYQVVMRPESTP